MVRITRGNLFPENPEDMGMTVVLPAVPEADAELIRASLERPDRFGGLYDRHAAQLYRYAFRRVGTLAEDVVADTFLAAFQGRHSYDLGRPDARPWLFGILTRKLADQVSSERAYHRRLAVAEPTVDDPADRVAARVSADVANGPVLAALGRLSRGERDVLLLIAWGQLSYEEVAAALTMPLGTVRSRLSRARRKVRDALGGVNPIDDEEDR
jgi:RNA polymerase sigma-70 factor (ECF subfamily)